MGLLLHGCVPPEDSGPSNTGSASEKSSSLLDSVEKLSEEQKQILQGAIREHLAQFIQPNASPILSTDRVEAAYRLLFAQGWNPGRDIGPCPTASGSHPDSIVVQIGTFNGSRYQDPPNGEAVGNPRQAEGMPAFVKLDVQPDDGYIRWSWIDEDDQIADVTTIEFLPGIDTRHGAMEAVCCRYVASEGTKVEDHNRDVLQWVMRAYVIMFQAGEVDVEAPHIREAFLQFQRALSIPYLLEAELVGMQNELVDMQNEFVNMQNEFVDMQNEFVDMQNELVDMQNKLVNMQNELVDRQSEIDAMHGFVTVVENSIRNGGYGVLRD